VISGRESCKEKIVPVLERGSILGRLKAEMDCAFCATVQALYQSIISGFTACDVYSIDLLSRSMCMCEGTYLRPQ
jgi:hypothetical protein